MAVVVVVCVRGGGAGRGGERGGGGSGSARGGDRSGGGGGASENVKDFLLDSTSLSGISDEIIFPEENENGVGAAVLRAGSSHPLIGCPVSGPTCTTAACPLAVCFFLYNSMSRRCSRKLFIRMLYNTGLIQELKVTDNVPLLSYHEPITTPPQDFKTYVDQNSKTPSNDDKDFQTSPCKSTALAKRMNNGKVAFNSDVDQAENGNSTTNPRNISVCDKCTQVSTCLSFGVGNEWHHNVLDTYGRGEHHVGDGQVYQ
ncbi:hypothetical protein ACROYT_G037769 [Oculina patagonica]